MRAVVSDAPGGPESLYLGEVSDPEPGDRDLLVRVRAAGVNRADLLQREGRYPPPPGASTVLGLELAGEVERVGAEVKRFKPGDRVMALVTGGAYAERASVPEGSALLVPAGWDWPQAASVPEAFLTAWLNLVRLGKVQNGETVLIHAAASGVGTAAVQLASEMGANVVATASAGKLGLCSELGADVAVDRESEDFVEVIEELTGGAGANLILDFVGAPYWERNTKAAARGGRIVLIGFLGGSRGELDLGPVLRKSLIVRGTTLRGTSRETKESLVRDFADFALPRFGDGRLRTVVDRVFNWSQAGEAHAYMAQNRNAGKIILEMD